MSKYLLVLLALILLPIPGISAEESENDGLLMFGPEGRRKQFLPMPLIVKNPTLGTGGGLAATLMFKTDYEDEDQPYSVVSIPGFYTNTQSWFVGSFASLHFMGDDLRIIAGGGYGRVNNEYEYESVTLEQEVSFAMGVLRGSYAVIPNLYVGGAYFLSQIWYRKFAVAGGPDIPIQDVFSSGVYVALEWDNRNSVYNPTSGFFGIFEPGFFPTWLGSDDTYITLDYAFNGYQRLADPLLLAYRVSGAHAFLDTPYSSLPTLGSGSDLRGYQAGQYRGENMITSQAEFRWNFVWQLYLTAFGGIGTFYGTEPTVPNIDDWDGIAFPSAGFGVSILTSEETGIMVRFDFAWGLEGEFNWYFQMGNSF